MANKQLTAEPRAEVGKGAARAVRRANRVPAVIYGAGRPATAISLPGKETGLLANAGGFLTTLFDIDLGGGRRERAIPRDVQRDPVKDRVLHIDFFRVSAGDQLKVSVPVQVVGAEEAPGIKEGGTVNVVLYEVELSVPAEAIPGGIEVDVSAMAIGDTVKISDLKLPEGATPTATDAEATVLTISPPLAEIVDEPVEAPVEVEVIGEEGEEGAGPGEDAPDTPAAD